MIQKITANPINMNVWTPENMAGLYFVVFQYWEVGVDVPECIDWADSSVEILTVLWTLQSLTFSRTFFTIMII